MLGLGSAREGWRNWRRRAVPEPWRSAFANSLCTPLNLHFLHELVQRLDRLGIEGDIVESGVYKGGSAAVLGWTMMQSEHKRDLWLFDSFAGMPPASERDGEFSHSLEGKTVGSEEQTRKVLGQAGVPEDRFRIVTGLYEDTYPTVDVPKIGLLHVDCDFHDPIKQTLERFFPAVEPGGFIVLNDYGIYKGAKEATDEFIAANKLGLEPVAIDPTAAFFQKPGGSFEPGAPVAGHYPGWEGAVA